MVIKHISQKILSSNPNLSEAELLSSIRDFSERNIFGVDINERMVRVAKMNMIMHGDGHSGIYNSHGLTLGHSDRLPIKDGSIDKIFSNPPFAGRESDPAHLARFETAKTDEGSLVSLHKAIPFVEMIIRLLRPGGRAALVLPNGIFNSPSRTFRKLREIIYTDTRIQAVVALPHWVFFHTGCDVQGSLLFLQKEAPPADYDIFMDWADHVGYDAKGSKTDRNDLPEVLERYRAAAPENLFPFSKIQANDRFDPLYYRPGSHEAFFEKGGEHTLKDLVEPAGIIVSESKKNKARYKYLEVGGADPSTGEIVELHEYPAHQLPSRAKWIVRENMVLFPNHRNSIASKRSPVLVPQEHDGIVVTSRFIPFHCKVAPQYVYHILNSDVIKEKLLKTVTGGSSTEIKWDVIKDIPVPVLPSEEVDTFLADVIELQSKIENMDRLLRRQRGELNKKFEELFHV